MIKIDPSIQGVWWQWSSERITETDSVKKKNML